ncbi:extragenic suppressor of the bimD6 mutation-related [Cryptosporidium ryanae]|uniref:extragenic suppressor of the bimD6 mutation-related n=1 Tax=Cryptosporidium ryanae TaxID=515981 RepID=UPI00351A3A06|nr:extragenic suppressor of the bimD6 mutation-related [Cryptosporidium ryanae]
MKYRQHYRTLKYDVLPGDICNLNQEVLNQAKASDDKGQRHRYRGLTRDTRATVMQTLDRRTIQILDKSKKRGVFTNMYGTISTGKEANVYRGTTTFEDLKIYGRELQAKNCLSEEDLDAINCIQNNSELNYVNRAIKVFKTSVLTFKDRSKYVEGEFRFRRGYLKSKNPRKMVTQWCEKEFRNLKRIVISGLRCPIPIYMKKHIFVMSFIGDGSDMEAYNKAEVKNNDEMNNIKNNTGNVAPRLKDAPINISKMNWIRLYIEMIGIMHIMFNKCHLIHGDMSEYNTLFYKGHLYVIDVSQSMEHDHPLGLEFLKRDCINASVFFSRVFQTRKELISEEIKENEHKKSDLDDETFFLNNLVLNTENYSTSFLLLPTELYKLITQVSSIELVNFLNDSLNSVENELNRVVKQIVLNVLETNEFVWPMMDSFERENDLKSSYLNSKKDEILLSTHNNSKIFLAILFLITRNIVNNEEKYSNPKLDIFSSTEKDIIISKNEDENKIFLNTWIPLHLNQILDRKTLEMEFDRNECGQKLLYGHLICNDDIDNKSNEHYSDFKGDNSNVEINNKDSCESSSTKSKVKKRTAIQDSDDNDSYNTIIDLNKLQESSEISTSGPESEDEIDDKRQLKFDGNIPKNFTKKEWKQKIKQDNRERRSRKIPKHIKKKKKKKHLQKKRA